MWQFRRFSGFGIRRPDSAAQIVFGHYLQLIAVNRRALDLRPNTAARAMNWMPSGFIERTLSAVVTARLEL